MNFGFDNILGLKKMQLFYPLHCVIVVNALQIADIISGVIIRHQHIYEHGTNFF